MRILNCTEAVTPALARTKLLLFTPFRWGRTWKLSITAYLSFAGTVFFPIMLLYLAGIPLLRGRAPAGMVWILVGAVAGITAVYSVIFLLCSRLQFAFFAIALNRGQFVAPAWRKYGHISWQWTLVKVAAGLIFVALCVGPCIAWGHELVNIFVALSQTSQPGQMPPAPTLAMMGAFYGFYFIALFVGGTYYLVMSTLSSFLVPSMALEGMGPRAAFARFTAFVRRETGAFLAFLGLRLAMSVAGYFCLTIALELTMLLIVVVVGGTGALIGLGLHAAGVPSTLLIAAAVVLGFGLLLAIWIYVFPLFAGPYFTFFEAHTLYFLGGRYPMLGELLEASTPAPPMVAPPYYSYASPVDPASTIEPPDNQN